MSPAKTKKEKPRPRRALVYLGARALQGGRLGHAYLPIAGAWEETRRLTRADTILSGDLGEASVWTKALGSYLRPGTIFEVEYDEGSPDNVYPKLCRTLGHLQAPDASALAAVHEATTAAHRARLDAKKEGARKLDLEALEPWRLAYRALRTRQEKAILLARLSEYVAGGRS